MSRYKKPGNFMQIPLEDGSFGYAKVLAHEVACLDLRTFDKAFEKEQLDTAKTF